jgi:hypothetical protein
MIRIFTRQALILSYTAQSTATNMARNVNGPHVSEGEGVALYLAKLG